MEKIVAYRNYKGISLVKVATELEDKLKMKILASGDGIVDTTLDAFFKFNLVAWEAKVSRVFPEINNVSEENKHSYLKESLERHFGEIIKSEKDIEYREVDIDSVDISKYEGESAKVIEQLSFFNEMPVPAKTIDFIQGYVNKIQDVELNKSMLRKIYTKYSEPISELEEYVMYIGNNIDRMGCIGKIIDTRDDIAPYKVELFVRNSKGSLVKCWFKEKNLVRFYI